MATSGTKCKIVPGAWACSLRGKATQTSWSTLPYSQKRVESNRLKKSNTDTDTETNDQEYASVFLKKLKTVESEKGFWKILTIADKLGDQNTKQIG